MKKKFRIFYSTCSNSKDAKIIANYLLKNRKALCVNLINNVDSFISRIKKLKIKEVSILIKTCCTKSQMEKNIKKIHKYQTPIVVELKTALPIKIISKWFLKIRLIIYC